MSAISCLSLVFLNISVGFAHAKLQLVAASDIATMEANDLEALQRENELLREEIRQLVQHAEVVPLDDEHFMDV